MPGSSLEAATSMSCASGAPARDCGCGDAVSGGVGSKAADAWVWHGSMSAQRSPHLRKEE